MAIFVRQKQTGIIIFTNGDEGQQVMRQIIGRLHLNPMLLPLI